MNQSTLRRTDSARRLSPGRARAFTLVEILIVVVILAILAAITIPQFSNASQEALKSTLRRQLQSIDDMVEVYRVNNAGALPTADPVAPLGAGGGWGVLVSNQFLKDTPFNGYTGGSVMGPGTTRAAAAGALPGHPVGWQFVVSANRLDIYASGYDEPANRLSNEP